MAFVIADRVRDTSTTTGMGNFTVSGTAPNGYRTLSAVMSTSDTGWYTISNQAAAEWEDGIMTFSGSNIFVRTTILSSSNSGSAVNFSAGTKDVYMTLPASVISALYNRATTAQALAGTDVLAPMTAASTQAVILAMSQSNYLFLA